MSGYLGGHDGHLSGMSGMSGMFAVKDHGGEATANSNRFARNYHQRR